MSRSPLSMMRSAPRRVPSRDTATRRARLWRYAVAALLIVALPIGWTVLWSYAASIANRALSGWIEREAALGRAYACGSQTIAGFPFGIVIRCDKAAAAFTSNRPPFDVRAENITFSAQVFRPTLLNGEVTSPVTLANPDQSPVFVANWSRAQLALLGLPPEPERVTVTLAKPRLDRTTGSDTGTIFQADRVEVDGRIIEGSARNKPVIEASAQFAAAVAPSFHPLLAEPLQGEIDTVMRGFKDFSPKPWSLRRRAQGHGGRSREHRATPWGGSVDRARNRSIDRRGGIAGPRARRPEPFAAGARRRGTGGRQYGSSRDDQKNGQADRIEPQARGGPPAARRRRHRLCRHHPRGIGAAVVLNCRRGRVNAPVQPI